MRSFFLINFLFFSFTLIFAGVPKTGYVIKVNDGDTVKLSTGQYVRYLGIDTPEHGEEYFSEAKRFNKKLVFGKKVYLEYGKRKKDRYGRLLAWIFVKKGKKKIFVNYLLVKNGYAHLYFFNPKEKYYIGLLDAQRDAIRLKEGIWKIQLIDTEKYYIGSKKSYIFHRPSCKWAHRISKKNRIVFKSKKAAFWQGYAPSRGCKP